MLRRLSSLVKESVFAKVIKNAKPGPPKAELIMRESEIIATKDNYIRCAGEGPLGHPAIYINLVKYFLIIGKP